jgi:hypothetical protein
MHVKLCQQVAKLVEGRILNTLTIVGIKFNGFESERCSNLLYNSLLSSIFLLFWNLFLIAMKFSKLDHLVYDLFMNLVVGFRNVVKTLNVYISLQETTSFKVVQLDCLVHFD